MTSGLYDLTQARLSDGGIAYFGADPARHAERSAQQGLLKSATPLMLAAAELDPPQFVKQLEVIKEMLCKREGGCARTLLLPQHSHMSETYAINTGDTRADQPDPRFHEGHPRKPLRITGIDAAPPAAPVPSREQVALRVS